MSEQIHEAPKLSPTGFLAGTALFSVEKPKNSKQVIRRLWDYMRKEKTLLLVIIVLLLINTGTTLAGSYLLRPIINHYIIPRNIPGLIKMAMLLLGIYIIGAVAAIFQNRLMILVAQRTVNVIRADLFSKLQSLPVKFYDSNNHGDIMSRFTNDVDNVSDSLNTSVMQLFTSTITLTGIFILMLYISPMLTLVTLVIVPLMLWVAALIIKKSKTYFATQQVALGYCKRVSRRNDNRAESG